MGCRCAKHGERPCENDIVSMGGTELRGYNLLRSSRTGWMARANRVLPRASLCCTPDSLLMSVAVPLPVKKLEKAAAAVVGSDEFPQQVPSVRLRLRSFLPGCAGEAKAERKRTSQPLSNTAESCFLVRQLKALELSSERKAIGSADFS